MNIYPYKKLAFLEEIIPELNDVNKNLSVWPDRIFIEFSKKKHKLNY